MMEVQIIISLGCVMGNEQTRKIECARSANSGSSWNTAVNVDGIDNGDVNEFRASPVIAANSDSSSFWAETNTESGSSRRSRYSLFVK